MHPIPFLVSNREIFSLIASQLSDVEHTQLLRTCTWARDFFISRNLQTIATLKSLLHRSVETLQAIGCEKAEQVAKILHAEAPKHSLPAIAGYYSQSLQNFYDIDFSFKERFQLKAALATCAVGSTAKRDLCIDVLPNVTLANLLLIMREVQQCPCLKGVEKPFTKMLSKYSPRQLQLQDNTLKSFELLDKCVAKIRKNDICDFPLLLKRESDDYECLVIEIFHPYKRKCGFAFHMKNKKYAQAMAKIENIEEGLQLFNVFKNECTFQMVLNVIKQICMQLDRFATNVELGIFYKKLLSSLQEDQITAIMIQLLPSSSSNLAQAQSTLSPLSQLFIIQSAVAHGIKTKEMHSFFLKCMMEILEWHLVKESLPEQLRGTAAMQKEIIDAFMGIIITYIEVNFPLNAVEILNACLDQHLKMMPTDLERIILVLIKCKFTAEALEIFDRFSNDLGLFSDKTSLICALISCGSELEALHFFNLVTNKANFIQSHEGKHAIVTLMRYYCYTLDQPEIAAKIIDELVAQYPELRERTAGALALAYARKGNQVEASKALEQVPASSSHFIKANIARIYSEASKR